MCQQSVTRTQRVPSRSSQFCVCVGGNTYTLFIKGYAEHEREREKVGWRESSDDNKGVTSNTATESEDHEIK